MKRYLIVILLLLSFHCSFGCDICGCSSGSYFIGPYPHFQKGFVGMRYSFRNFFSRMANDPDEFSKDLYQTAELWAGFNIGKRWQILGFIPYNINRQKMEHHPHEEQGVGDVSLIANYQLITRLNNQLLIGGGIKLPTGKFDPSMTNHPVPSANVQPGSGSVDYLLNASHVLKMTKWALHSNANYKINGTKKEFQFGNRVNASALISRVIGNKTIVSPFAGFQYEHLAANKFQKKTIEDTGGHAVLGTAGIDLQLGKINVGANIQLPLLQNFSNNQTDARVRGMIQVGFVF